MANAARQTGALDPEAGRLLQERRARERRKADSRELWSGLGFAAAFLAAAVPLALLIPGDRHPSGATVVSLVLAYALACNVRFEVGTGWVVPTQLVLVPMFFLIPVGWVPLCVAASHAIALIMTRRVHASRAVYLALSDAWYAVGPALVLGLAVAAPRVPTLDEWPIYVVALASQFAIDYARSVVRPWLVLRVSPLAHAREIGHAYMVDAALAPIGFAVAFVAFLDPVGIALVFPLIGLLTYFSRERRARIEHALELGDAYRGTALLLGDVVEADNAYTGEHSRDVVSLVLAVSDRLGLDARARQQAEFVALLHDVGKIRIPNEIINKPGPLTAEERAVIETHTVAGEEMLARIGGLLGEVGELVRSCHERWDGSGYPDGLAGEAIPLVSRIVCACDAFNAMTTDRPYREGRSPEEGLAELRRCAGTHFDPAVVEALAAVVGVQDVRVSAA